MREKKLGKKLFISEKKLIKFPSTPNQSSARIISPFSPHQESIIERCSTFRTLAHAAEVAGKITVVSTMNAITRNEKWVSCTTATASTDGFDGGKQKTLFFFLFRFD